MNLFLSSKIEYYFYPFTTGKGINKMIIYVITSIIVLYIINN